MRDTVTASTEVQRSTTTVESQAAASRRHRPGATLQIPIWKFASFDAHAVPGIAVVGARPLISIRTFDLSSQRLATEDAVISLSSLMPPNFLVCERV